MMLPFTSHVTAYQEVWLKEDLTTPFSFVIDMSPVGSTRPKIAAFRAFPYVSRGSADKQDPTILELTHEPHSRKTSQSTAVSLFHNLQTVQSSVIFSTRDFVHLQITRRNMGAKVPRNFRRVDADLR